MNRPSDFRRAKSEARSIDELIRFGCRDRFSAQSWGIKRTDDFREAKSEARSVDELIKRKCLSLFSAQRMREIEGVGTREGPMALVISYRHRGTAFTSH